MEHWWDDIDRKNRSIWIKPCPIATLSTTNPTLTGLEWNSAIRGGPSAANSLSYATARLWRTQNSPGALKELLMVFGLNMSLRLKYTTAVLVLDNILQHSTPTEIWYTHRALKHVHPSWSPCLTLHTGAAVSPRTAHAERSRLTAERIRVVVKVAQSILQEMQPIPTAQEVTMYSGIQLKEFASSYYRVWESHCRVCSPNNYLWFLPVAWMCVCFFSGYL
jgi:hypothetical protein